MAITPAMLRRGKAISQENRLGVFHPPDDPGRGKTHDLALLRFDGVEAINRPFEFRVECLSVTPNIDFDKLLGRHASVEIETVDPALPPRFFDGLLTEARWLGNREGAHGYELILRPGLWLLTLRQDQRIFHQLRPPEILQQVFGPYGFDVSDELSESYPTLEYTVQYRETDFDFVTRLMSRFGISYRFAHRKHGHTLVLSDGNDAFPKAPGGKRPFRPVAGQHRDKTEHFVEFAAKRRMTTGKVSMLDYNFKSPTSAMDNAHVAGHGYEHGEIESFAYPGGYPEQGDGKPLAKLRSLQAASTDRHFHGVGDVISLSAGEVFMLVDAPAEYTDLDREEFVVLAARHSYEAEGYRAGADKPAAEGAGGGARNYQSEIEAVMRDTAVVPPPVRCDGKVDGPQTATVVGEGEIDCDEHGRILVRFHWDRAGAHSMRCRVAQLWAGNGWGSMFIPRVGMEVVVQFIEGDPDQPLVIGCVYNGQNAPPWGLPGDKNSAGIKSNSTPGGGGYNEIALDDSDGNELFRVHAQYDMDTVVLHDERRRVDNDRGTEIVQDETLKVGRNRKAEIGTNDTLDVGKVLEIEAGQKISLKVGMSSIVLESDKITLKSPQISIKASAKLETSAGMASEHSAGATFDIKGALVKINS